MLGERANKEARPSANKCPRCGRREGMCRAVPLGFWCQQHGLVEDPSRWIVPTPDPIHEAVQHDPEVLEAQTAMELAELDYQAADAAWVDAISAASTLRLKDGVAVFATTGGVITPQARGRRKEVSPRQAAKLIDAEAEAQEARDDQGKMLVRARVAYQRAVAEARRRHTPAPG